MGKCGTASTHCCWFAGEQCQYVAPSIEPGFQWTCALRKREGSWTGVHTSDEYRNNVKAKLLAAGLAQDCGDWPPLGMRCNDCGEQG